MAAECTPLLNHHLRLQLHLFWILLFFFILSCNSNSFISSTIIVSIIIILVLIIIIVSTVIIIPIVVIISVVIIRGWIQLCLESGNLGGHSFHSLIPFLDGPLQLLYVLGVLLHSTMKMCYGCISGYQGIL